MRRWMLGAAVVGMVLVGAPVGAGEVPACPPGSMADDVLPSNAGGHSCVCPDTQEHIGYVDAEGVFHPAPSADGDCSTPDPPRAGPEPEPEIPEAAPVVTPIPAPESPMPVLGPLPPVPAGGGQVLPRTG